METTRPAPGGTAIDESPQQLPEPPSPFIIFRDGPGFADELRTLTLWTHNVLLPYYGREVSSTALWCPSWWEHLEAVAQLHGLFLCWQELTHAEAGPSGPARWHRDFLGPVMQTLRDPAGPFAGCGRSHRDKELPPVTALDPFGPPEAD